MSFGAPSKPCVALAHLQPGAGRTAACEGTWREHLGVHAVPCPSVFYRWRLPALSSSGSYPPLAPSPSYAGPASPGLILTSRPDANPVRPVLQRPDRRRRMSRVAGLDARAQAANAGRMGKWDPSFTVGAAAAYKRDMPAALMHRFLAKQKLGDPPLRVRRGHDAKATPASCPPQGENHIQQVRNAPRTFRVVPPRTPNVSRPSPFRQLAAQLEAAMPAAIR